MDNENQTAAEATSNRVPRLYEVHSDPSAQRLGPAVPKGSLRNLRREIAAPMGLRRLCLYSQELRRTAFDGGSQRSPMVCRAVTGGVLGGSRGWLFRPDIVTFYGKGHTPRARMQLVQACHTVERWP